MEWVHSLIAGILGLSLGSFCSVLVCRIPEGKSVVFGRSQCMHCHKQLSWFELIPALSFLLCSLDKSSFKFQRARCRTCKREIAWSYLVREIWMGMLSLGLYLAFDWSLDWGKYLIFGLLLTTISEIDFRYGIVPDQLVLAGSMFALLLQVMIAPDTMHRFLLAGASSLALLLIVREGSRQFFGRVGIGMGDVKLMVMVAFFIGWQGIWAFYLATIMGGFIGLAGIALRQWSRSTQIPFAPFITLGVGFSSFVLPEDVLSWLTIISG